jgi:hypothetical protein
MKKAVFWDVAPCRCGVNRRFGGTYRLHFQGRRKNKKIRMRRNSESRWKQTNEFISDISLLAPALTILWYDAWKPEFARQRLGKHIPAEANTRNNRRAVFFVDRAALVATKRWGSESTNNRRSGAFWGGRHETIKRGSQAGEKQKWRSRLMAVEDDWEEMERNELGCAKNTSYVRLV